MKRLPASLLQRLDLVSAVEAEASSTRNQIPPEPWVSTIGDEAHIVADWVRDRLAAGYAVLPNAVVNARKASLGSRPVPILGICERVAYRALASLIIEEVGQPDRSADAYRKFLLGPIESAFEGATVWRVRDARFKYIVEADVTSFYEYVDHDLLQRELELQTGQLEAIQALIELLGETQQRSFGLPQLLDASDWLSEIYIRIAERQLVRAGWHTWRYNDDFRIGCSTYTDAIDAIEQLEVAVRSVGLTLSDYKTYTPSFLSYLTRNTNLEIDPVSQAVDPTDVEAIVADYTAMEDGESPDSATITLSRLTSEPVGSTEEPLIYLKKPTREDIRDLTRAINSLMHYRDPGGLEFVVGLSTFIPSLTPRLCDYIVSVDNDDTRDRVVALVSEIVGRQSLGEWQAMWFVHVCRRLGLHSDSDGPIRIWIRQQRERGRGRPLGAESALALAEVGAIGLDDLDLALRTEPEVLAPWFVLAIKSASALNPTKQDRARVSAVRDSNPLNRILLKSTSNAD